MSQQQIHAEDFRYSLCYHHRCTTALLSVSLSYAKSYCINKIMLQTDVAKLKLKVKRLNLLGLQYNKIHHISVY